MLFIDVLLCASLADADAAFRQYKPQVGVDRFAVNAVAFSGNASHSILSSRSDLFRSHLAGRQSTCESGYCLCCDSTTPILCGTTCIDTSLLKCCGSDSSSPYTCDADSTCIGNNLCCSDNTSQCGSDSCYDAGTQTCCTSSGSAKTCELPNTCCGDDLCYNPNTEVCCPGGTGSCPKDTDCCGDDQCCSRTTAAPSPVPSTLPPTATQTTARQTAGGTTSAPQGVSTSAGAGDGEIVVPAVRTNPGASTTTGGSAHLTIEWSHLLLVAFTCVFAVLR